jgi:hypothetical protein
MDIGDPTREYVVEPVEDPVPRTVPEREVEEPEIGEPGRVPLPSE